MLLFDKIIFGPIQSRRLGVSLGINLLPTDGKVCSFDCIYCECGYNAQGKGSTGLPEREEVAAQLEDKLKSMKEEGMIPNVLTFAGNGEPTLHPQFAGIIDDTIKLRDKYFPEAKISVLSNGTMVGKKDVFDALLKIDNNILKLDSAIEGTVKLIDSPNAPGYSVRKIIDIYKKFNGKLIIQTLFLRGAHNGQIVDNTTDTEINAWLGALKEIHPESVMIYSIDRDTPEEDLVRLSKKELENIADKARKNGFEVSVSA